MQLQARFWRNRNVFTPAKERHEISFVNSLLMFVFESDILLNQKEACQNFKHLKQKSKFKCCSAFTVH